MKRFFHFIFVTTATAIAQGPCGSDSQVLFQSNAHYSDWNFLSSYKGGSVFDTEEKWNELLESFMPENYDEPMSRTSIDFSMEKVVLGTYFTASSCMVDISHAELECAASADGSPVQMKMVMDVFDSSLNCDIICGALGQVVYAVAVPLEWEINEDTGFHINVVGPCSSTSGASTSQYAEQEAIMLDTATTGALTTSSQSTVPNTVSQTSILLGTQTTAAPVEFEEVSNHSNDVTIRDSPGTTPSPIATAEEPALVEKQQLRATTPPIVVDDVMIQLDEPPEAAYSNDVLIKLDTTTTAPASETETTTIATTTTVSTANATEPIIPSPSSLNANDPANALSSSSSSWTPQLISFAVVIVGTLF